MNNKFGLKVMLVVLAVLGCGSAAGEPDAAHGVFKVGTEIFAVEPGAAVRGAASAQARVIARLPMGTAVQSDGGWSNHSPYCNENGAEADADKAGWLCISTYAIPGEGDLPFYGWVAASGFGTERPRLDALLEQYDRTPKDDLAARRKWAERAIGLDPMSQEAQRRLTEVLAGLGDQAALQAAKDSFAAWQARQPAVAAGESPAIYGYDGFSLTRLASVAPGELRRGDIGAAVRPGQFYHVYSGGRRMGTVATVLQFECEPRECPAKVPVRALDLAALPPNQPAYAANIALPENKPAPAITSSQKTQLAAMMRAEINALRSRERREVLLTALRTTRNWASTGRLGKDGKLFLVGQLVVGAASGEFHGGAEPILASLRIIAEQQKGGRFKKVEIAPPRQDECFASDNVDFDGDGTDEIVLTCRPTGAYYNYGLLKRVKGRWTRAF